MESVAKTRQLLERLYDPEPLRPMSMFGINKSNFLTAKSTIVTYAVVMLQFKVTDYQNSQTNNSTNTTATNCLNLSDSQNLSDFYNISVE
jgi:hypothetical protein